MKKLKLVLGLLLVSTLAFTGCLKTEKTESGLSKETVATVYGENITKGEFDKSFEIISKSIEYQYKLQGEADAKAKKEGKKIDENDQQRLPAKKEDYMKQQKEAHLKALVEKKMYYYQAEKNKIKVTDKEVEAKVKETKDAWLKEYKTEDKLKEEIKKNSGVSYEEYMEWMKESTKDKLTIEKLQELIVKDVKVTDEEAKKEYDENPYKYTEEPNKLIFSHILLNDEATAKKVKAELDGGAKIADIASKYSQDPGSKDKGGKYEEGLEYAQLDPAFLKGALSQEIDAIGDPIKGQPREGKDSYYIVQVHEKKEYPAKKFDAVKAEIKEGLLQQKQSTVAQEKVTKWQEEAKIKEYPEKL